MTTGNEIRKWHVMQAKQELKEVEYNLQCIKRVEEDLKFSKGLNEMRRDRLLKIIEEGPKLAE